MCSQWSKSRILWVSEAEIELHDGFTFHVVLEYVGKADSAVGAGLELSCKGFSSPGLCSPTL